MALLHGRLVAPAVVAVFAAVMFLVATGSALADNSVSVTINPINKSGISGSAQVIARGNQTEVIIAEPGEPTGVSQPVHIHEGLCTNMNPRPTYPLNDIENGRSDTIVNAPISRIASGRYVINVHHSAADIGTYVACGAISSAGAAKPSVVWTTGTAMPSKRAWLGIALGANEKIYAIGGTIADSEYPALVEEYDPTKSAWSTKASLPTARYDLGVAAMANGTIYAIGGCCGREALPTVEVYDSAKNTWTPRASMPTARRSLALAVTSNGKIYAIGGSSNGQDYLKTVEEYDPATNTWTARASMPTARASLGAAAVGDKIYAIGGITTGHAFLSTVEEYDPTTNTWTARASMPTPRGALGVVESGGKIYAIGGTNSGHEELSTVEVFDPAANTWSSLASLPTARSAMGVATNGHGKIYVIGGCCAGDGSLLGSVDVATILIPAAAPAAGEQAEAAPDAATPTVIGDAGATTNSTGQPIAAPSATSLATTAPVRSSAAAPTPALTGSGIPLEVILGFVAFVIALVALGVLALTRRTSVVAPSAALPPSPVSASTPVGVSSWPVASGTPVPASAPPSAWPGSAAAPVSPPPVSPSPPPASWPPPAFIPSAWPHAFGTPGTAAQTVYGPGGAPPPGMEGFPVGYQVVGAPKSGGMASVFKAYQPALDRYVALKVMSPTLTNDPAFVQRFYDEARRTARLEHPNIVPIYDVGQTPNGSLFISMRYVDGISLQELLALERPLESARAGRIALQVAEALEHAHSRGIIHRDVKPSNVMVEPGDRVTLMDFGIAKVVGDTRLTRNGAIVGTPKYISPEQATGFSVDHRSDLYALGVMLYEMLAGRAPFEAETPTAMLYAHVNLPPPPPTEINAAIPPAVATVVLKALAKNPAERFQTARDFRVAVRDVLAPAPESG